MNNGTARQHIEHFWQTMNTNDWQAASGLLHDDYLLVYPQSGERFRGREHFIALNSQYPAAGAWRFTVQRLIADETEAVTDVGVTRWRAHGPCHLLFRVPRRAHLAHD
jgi:hypothetical protein